MFELNLLQYYKKRTVLKQYHTGHKSLVTDHDKLTHTFHIQMEHNTETKLPQNAARMASIK